MLAYASPTAIQETDDIQAQLVSQGIREIVITYRGRPPVGIALPKIQSPRNVAEAFNDLRDLPHEEVWVALLGSGNDLLGRYQVAKGGISEAPFPPREVFIAALLANAAAVIMVHNHPSGRSQPSAEDRECTRGIVQTSKLIGIPLIDHVVLGLHDWFSFADHNLLEEYRRAPAIPIVQREGQSPAAPTSRQSAKNHPKRLAASLNQQAAPEQPCLL